ncbi:MAG TPA: lipopolysaccharide kinase InaA family protein, partial [Gemmatimonadaceae bacterium]|nr:lipopolysaccharide kinase InaA family protein [Gemmatimonadaceae bacterium]
ELQGRGIVHAVPLPEHGPRVVVRHARHGGLLAPLTGDRFLAPTRAPHELRVAVRLADAGVPTPRVVAYAVYPAGPGLRRADVATAEIAGGLDLPAALAAWPEARAELLHAVGQLIATLGRAGARHPDLNVKNVLLTPGSSTTAPQAYVLDVDRVRFRAPGDAATSEANVRRLLRSARKWGARHGTLLDAAEMAALRHDARTLAPEAA